MGCCSSGIGQEGDRNFAEYQSKSAAHKARQTRDGFSGDELSRKILAAHAKRPKGHPPVTRVRPLLLLGSLYDALDSALLQSEGVTHAVNATRARIPADGLSRLDVAIDDDPSEDIFREFGRVCNFLNGATTGGGRVLVHCEQGVSRSATLLAAFLMRSEGSSAQEAIQALKGARQIVCPNEGFLRALAEWQALLRPESDAPAIADLHELCQATDNYKRLEMLRIDPKADALNL